MTIQADTNDHDAAAASGPDRQPAPAEGAPGVSRAGLDRALRQWLPDYCRQVPGLTRAFAIAPANEDGPGIRQVARWPEDLHCPKRTLELGAVAL